MLTLLKVAAVFKVAGFVTYMFWRKKTLRRREFIRKTIYRKAG